MKASVNGKDDIVELLINAKADINMQAKASIESTYLLYWKYNANIMCGLSLHAGSIVY